MYQSNFEVRIRPSFLSLAEIEQIQIKQQNSGSTCANGFFNNDRINSNQLLSNNHLCVSQEFKLQASLDVECMSKKDQDKYKLQMQLQNSSFITHPRYFYKDYQYEIQRDSVFGLGIFLIQLYQKLELQNDKIVQGETKSLIAKLTGFPFEIMLEYYEAFRAKDLKRLKNQFFIKFQNSRIIKTHWNCIPQIEKLNQEMITRELKEQEDLVQQRNTMEKYSKKEKIERYLQQKGYVFGEEDHHYKSENDIHSIPQEQQEEAEQKKSNVQQQQMVKKNSGVFS